MTSLEIFPRKCVYMLWCFSDDFRKLFKIPSFRTGPKYAESDAFVVTAYLTDKPKAGETVWPKK